jgi:hypothetical protein
MTKSCQIFEFALHVTKFCRQMSYTGVLAQPQSTAHVRNVEKNTLKLDHTSVPQEFRQIGTYCKPLSNSRFTMKNNLN